VTTVATQQERLPPGETRPVGGGFWDRFFSLITGQPGAESCAGTVAVSLNIVLPCKRERPPWIRSLQGMRVVHAYTQCLIIELYDRRVPFPDWAKLCAADDPLRGAGRRSCQLGMQVVGDSKPAFPCFTLRKDGSEPSHKTCRRRCLMPCSDHRALSKQILPQQVHLL